MLLAKRYGPSSEKASEEQLRLFNEAEAETDAAPAEAQEIDVPAHTRQKPGRGMPRAGRAFRPARNRPRLV